MTELGSIEKIVANLTINTNPVVNVGKNGIQSTVKSGQMYQIVITIGDTVTTSNWFFASPEKIQQKIKKIVDGMKNAQFIVDCNFDRKKVT